MYQYQINCFNTVLGIYRLPYELVNANMYFIPSGDTGVVIDPNENESLLTLFKKHGTRKVVIVLTHEHYDHTIGVEWLQSCIKTRLFCQQRCSERIATMDGNDPRSLAIILTIRDAADGGHRRDDFMATAKRYILKADETFTEECDLTVGDIKLRCYPAPGHSPGSAIYIMEGKYVFTGDSLIQDTPTILRLPGSDRNAFKSVTRPFLRSLDKDMTVFPGHGEPFKLGEAKYL